MVRYIYAFDLLYLWTQNYILQLLIGKHLKNGGLTHIHIFGTLYLSQPFCSVYLKFMVALIITLCMFYERFNMAVVRWASWVMAQKSVLRYFGLYMQHYTLHRIPRLKIFQVLIASRHVLAGQSSLLCKAMMTKMDSEKT